jgi:enoyl-CoA hydratase
MTDEIQYRVIGNLGHITLNRPKALNALTYAMCEKITELLLEWQDNSEIGAVLIDGAGDRAFCAGGDVILLHDSGKAGDSRAEEFWRIEYALNELIHCYSKPYISLIDGFVMGGGVGLSVHGKYRVAGDATVFAMPETGIGYFPDVGGTFFLPRLGMSVGQWLGLTGARLNVGQTCDIGIANLYVPTDKHSDLIEALGMADLDGTDSRVNKVLEAFSQVPPAHDVIPKAIKAFNCGSVSEILLSLDRDNSEWAAKQAKNIRRKSPIAMCVTFEALKRGINMTFRQVMTQELDISLNFLRTQDFYEGIRSQLIDKDRNPKWSHSSVDEVSYAQVEQLFRKTANPPQEFIT